MRMARYELPVTMHMKIVDSTVEKMRLPTLRMLFSR